MSEMLTALFWQDMLGERVTVATFDHHLGDAARTREFGVWPAGFA